MLTQFGKAIRVFRIERDEKLIDMAKNLGISESYLSMIENGHKPVTDDFMQRIRKAYRMKGTEWEQLQLAQIRTEKYFNVHIEKPGTADLVLLFAMKVNTLSGQKRKAIFEMLKED